MKIIGETTDGFIFEATRDEMANLVGYHSNYSLQAESATDKPYLKIGTEIAITAMFRQLYDLEHNKKELGALAVRLRRYADTLDAVRPILPVEGD